MTLPILVDCDGVLSNMTRSVLQLAAEHGYLDKLEEDIADWSYASSIGWPSVNAAITNATLTREFVYRMRPYPGAFMALRRLEAAFGKENVLVCTSPWPEAPGEWAAQRYAWLRYFASVESKRVIMCSAKHLVPGFLIDDHPKQLEGRPFENAFLVARPHNATATRFIRGTLEQAVDGLIPQSPPAFPERAE